MSPPRFGGTWYEATACPAPHRAPLRGAMRCDVVVIGGGYTGLSAALHLAERGYGVALLEAARIGDGPSGRNGGQILTAFNPPMAAIAHKVGQDDARLLWDLAIEAKALIRDRVARHGIACDLTAGHIEAAATTGQLAGLAATLADWQDTYGYAEARLAGAEEMPALVGCPSYRGGLYDGGGGHLHPLAYARGLAAAAEQAGARLFEDSAVSRLEAVSDGVIAAAAEGEVRASFAVLTGDPGAGPALILPGPAGSLTPYVVPVETTIIATEPLGPAAAAAIPSNAAVCDCKLAVAYYRRTPDHRILFGGGSSVLWPGVLGHGDMPPPALVRELRRTLPAVAGARIDHAWSGTVGLTPSQLPRFGRVAPTILFAHGFSGQGVALTGIAGRVLAEAVAGTAERFDVFARLPHRRFPGGPWLRLPALILARAWRRVRERL